MSTMAKTAVTWPQRIFVADIGWPSNGSTQLEGLCPLSGIQYRCAEHRTAAHVSEGILILRSDQHTNSRLRPKFHSTPLCGHHDARGFDTTRQASLRSVGNAPFNLDGPWSPRILDCEKYKLDRPLAQAPAKLPHEWGFPAQRIRQRRPQLTSGLANHSGAGAWSTALRWPSYSIDVSDATTPRLWRHANSAWSPTPSITCRTASWPCGHPAPPLSGVQVRYAFFFRWDVPRFTRC